MMLIPPKVFKELSFIVLISTIAGITSQKVLPHGISIKTELTVIGSDSNTTTIPSVSIDPGGNMNSAESIGLKAAYAAYHESRTLFLDARSSQDFKRGHILNAVNLPAHAFMDSLAMLDQLDLDQTLITYCDGVECNASIDLAANLKLMGFNHVYFFFGGWQEWKAADYPIAGSP